MMVRFTVEDRGPGIPAERRAGPFDRFDRASPHTEAEYARFLQEGSWRGAVTLRRTDGLLVQAEARATAVQLPGGVIFTSALRAQAPTAGTSTTSNGRQRAP